MMNIGIEHTLLRLLHPDSFDSGSWPVDNLVRIARQVCPAAALVALIMSTLPSRRGQRLT